MKVSNVQKSSNLTEELVESRKSSVSEFGNVEHRLQYVNTINGVEYINDSKATDINSTWYSLEYMTKKVIWIVGISEIESDYSLFNDLIKDKVRAIVCIGQNREHMFDELASNVELFAEAESLKEAVEIASNYSISGDVVLFSPACSSFDMFQDYKDRGEQFCKALTTLE